MSSMIRLGTNFPKIVFAQNISSTILKQPRTISYTKFYSTKDKATDVEELDIQELEKYKQYYKDLQTAIHQCPEEITSKSVGLITLHNRLDLPKEFSTSLLARCLTCRSSNLLKLKDTTTESYSHVVSTNNYCDNQGLNIFGKNLLTFHVTKYLLQKYPRLPTVVLNTAVDAYISENILASIAKSWGIEAETVPIINRYLRNEPISITLGKLRFMNNILSKKDGIERITKLNFSEESAYSLFVRSVIGGLWTINPDLSELFIKQHILSRKLDVSKLFRFEQPTRELAKLCQRENLERPVSKLIAESGRLSKAPLFIVGVFSNNEKLGEGFGSSLKEAKARAATDALLKWYCYEPIPNIGQDPVIDHGTVIV